MSESSRSIQQLYEALPWPPPNARGTRRSILLSSWLTGAVFPRRYPIAHGRRVLVAGCGCGESALELVKTVAGIEVVGVDLSQPAVSAAQDAIAGLERDDGLADQATARFVCADLTNTDDMAALGSFDLVICHAVADYVPDRRALLTTLAGALNDHGVVYLSANTPDHPAAAVRHAFNALGVPPVSLAQAVQAASGTDSGGLTPVQRQTLRMVAAALGAGGGVPELGELPASVLAADVFYPFAHHLPPHQWVTDARDAGLVLAGSRVTSSAIADVLDSAVLPLLGLCKGALGELFQRLRHAPSVEMLLSASRAEPPPFDDLKTLGSWVPSLDESLPAHALPEWSADQPDVARPLRVQSPGYPEVTVHTTAASLAVLRAVDGTRTLADCARIAGVGLQDVYRPVWRAWVSDLLHLRSP